MTTTPTLLERIQNSDWHPGTPSSVRLVIPHKDGEFRLAAGGPIDGEFWAVVDRPSIARFHHRSLAGFATLEDAQRAAIETVTEALR